LVDHLVELGDAKPESEPQSFCFEAEPRYKAVPARKVPDPSSLVNSPELLAIHYSCELFKDCTQHTPTISAIVVRDVTSGESHSFAAYLVAERLGISRDDLLDQFPTLEKELLRDFYAFVATRRDAIWLHWKLREARFGFQALAQRFAAHGGKPLVVPSDHQIHLAHLLKQKYGEDYIAHPRLPTLIRRNRLNDRGLLSDADSAKAWESKNWSALAASAQRKVECIVRLYELFRAGELRTNKTGPWWDGERHELLFNGSSVKRYVKPGPEQEKILQVFEEEGWPECIDDPWTLESCAMC
jgi:hypothetical protein